MFNASGCNSPEEVDSACVYLSNDEIKLPPSFTIFPNPTITNINIALLPHQKGMFTIFDVNGKVVHQEMIQEGRNNIDISGLNAGFYIYQIQVENEAIESGKFIKL
jgi:hypothetical protein